jgi:hypothetical protein
MLRTCLQIVTGGLNPSFLELDPTSSIQELPSTVFRADFRAEMNGIQAKDYWLDSIRIPV